MQRRFHPFVIAIVALTNRGEALNLGLIHMTWPAKRMQSTTGLMVCAAATAVLFSFALPAGARTPNPARQAQTPQAVGSLSSAGSVLVNGSPAPADVTIFSGDVVRTTEGSAAFSLSGKGAFKLAPHSEMAFQADPRYTGELRAGTVLMNSFGGATDISLRVGNYVVAPVIQADQSASKIERHSDGSFTIACLGGSVGLIPLEGATGRVLQSGETAHILASGELEQTPGQPAPPPTPVEETPAAAATKPVDQTPAPVPAKGSSKKNEYILLGLAGVAAVGAAAALAGGGHGSSSVSPSSP